MVEGGVDDCITAVQPKSFLCPKPPSALSWKLTSHKMMQHMAPQGDTIRACEKPISHFKKSSSKNAKENTENNCRTIIFNQERTGQFRKHTFYTFYQVWSSFFAFQSMFWQAFHVKARQWNWGCWKKGSYTPTLFKSIAPPSYMKQNHAIVTTPSILPPDLGCIIGQCREGKLVNKKVKWFVSRIVVLWFTTWYLNNAMNMLSAEVEWSGSPVSCSDRR